MSTSLLRSEYNYTNIYDILDNISNPTGSGAYFFVANPGDTSNSESPNNTVSSITDLYQNMVFGKKITSDDVNIMIRKYTWTSNTIYQLYDDTVELEDTEFYVVSQEDEKYYVFLCIDNNNDSESTEQPLFSETSADDNLYQLTDGYVWKYMFSIDSDTYDKFSNDEYIPYVEDSNVTDNAVSGSIDMILVEDGGKYYNNTCNGQFQVDQLRVDGDSLAYQLSNSASSANDYYKNCMLVITEGTGKGEYRLIDSYIGTSRLAYVNSAFSTTLDTTSVFEVSPKVVITGDGWQITNAEARALINTSSSNSVYRVEILDRGEGYRFATANVKLSGVEDVSNTAELRPIPAPYYGHGGDCVHELYGNYLGLAQSFNNNESNSISTASDYSTLGILINPLWNYVTLYINDFDGDSGSNGDFTESEVVYQYIPALMGFNVSVTANSNYITSNNAYFANFLDANSIVIANTSSGKQLFHVNAVTNTTIECVTNSIYTDSNAQFIVCDVSAYGTINAVPTGEIILGNVSGTFTANYFLIGNTTYAEAIVNNYTINEKDHSFDTFNQLSEYVGTLDSGTFIDNEKVELDTGLANANFHSIREDANNSTYLLYLYNEDGIFQIGNSVIGDNSSAHFTISNKYTGELVKNSGDIVYQDNFDAISRSNTQTESVKVIIKY